VNKERPTLNNEIIKQVTSSWSLFIQLERNIITWPVLGTQLALGGGIPAVSYVKTGSLLTLKVVAFLIKNETEE